MTSSSRGLRVVAHGVLWAACLVILLPAAWAVLTSFKPTNEIFSLAPIARQPTLDQYRGVFDAMPMMHILTTTFEVATAVTLGTLSLAVCMSYALVRWTLPARRALFLLCIGPLLIPFQVTMVPNYLLRTLWSVLLPNVRPALATLAILVFLQTWNEYFWPLLVARKIDNSMLQVGLQLFLQAEGNAWGQLMAAATLAALPVVLLYVVAQRHIMESFVRSGLR